MGWDRNAQFSLEEVDPGNIGDVKAVTDLHLKLIGRGEMAQLGRLFLERVCYEMMIRDRLLKAFLFRLNGVPIGFISLTPYAVTFYRRAARRHFPSIALLLAWSMIRAPRTIKPLIQAIRLILRRYREVDPRREPAAEILGIGVLPECRTPLFIHQTGLRIADVLFGRAVSYFRSLGLEKMDIFYHEFDMPTLFFYLNLGGKLTPGKHSGESLSRISFDFDQIETRP